MASQTSKPVLPTHEHQLDRFREPCRTVSSIRIDGEGLKRLALSLRDFLIATWLDWLTIVIIGITAAGVWVAPPTFTRLFPVTSPENAIYWPELAYPYVTPIFSPAGAGVIAATIPIITFAVAQLWLQSFVDFSSAVLGLAYAMVTGTCFQVILKKTIGGLRPHFLAVCQPVFPPTDRSSGVGFHNAMYTAEQVCTGDPDKIKNALESFPSGHAEVAFAGLGYLSIYLFTHLRITALSRRGSHWKMLLTVTPLLLATYLTSSLVLGYHHHGYDVVFGALIGCFMAFMGYRMAFMGVVDGRWNTEPYLRFRNNSGGQMQEEGANVDGVPTVSDSPRRDMTSHARTLDTTQGHETP